MRSRRQACATPAAHRLGRSGAHRPNLASKPARCCLRLPPRMTRVRRVPFCFHNPPRRHRSWLSAAQEPGRVHQRELSFGKVTTLFPQASTQRCTAALILEVDCDGLVPGKGDQPGQSTKYIKDRPYAASSFPSVGMARAWREALSGHGGLILTLTTRLSSLRSHLQVLIPVLDDRKHYSACLACRRWKASPLIRRCEARCGKRFFNVVPNLMPRL